MPELPEVEIVARGLARRLTGRIVERVRLSRTDIVRGTFCGNMNGKPVPLARILGRRRVERIERRGKQVYLELSEGIQLYVHLGMSGRLTVMDKQRAPEPHTHLRVTFKDLGEELRYCDPRRFGGIWVVRGTENTSKTPVPQGPQYGWVGRRLPPIHADPLRLSLCEFQALLRRRRQIKALLLAQEPISGIGNIYCDEALHRAGIHPSARAGDLDMAAVGRLWRALQRVLLAAIEAGGSSIRDYRSADNAAGGFQRLHRVYGRTGLPCRRCRTPIQKLTFAGRGTHICPNCQRTLKT